MPTVCLTACLAALLLLVAVSCSAAVSAHDCPRPSSTMVAAAVRG